MGIIGPLVDAVTDVITAVVDIVVQVVEFVVEFIMQLLGYDEVTQTIEYFEVHNLPLFDDPDGLNPLLETIQEAIITNSDIAGELIYASTFRDYKGDIKKFMNFIEDGNYNEKFPAIDSYITYPDYDELTASLLTLRGAACTIENAYTRAPTIREWVEYWLQENKTYSYENRTIPNVQVVDESTSPASTGSGNATSGGSSPNLTLAITDEVATSDTTTGTISELSIDLGSIVYNSSSDTYSVNANDDGGKSHTLPYTIPSKPTGLHYIASYYVNSAPGTTYLFLYKVGEGTYPDLDDPQNEINLNATILQAIPAIPLRLNNVDYVDMPTTTPVFTETSGTSIQLTINDDIQVDDSFVVNSEAAVVSTSKTGFANRIESLGDLVSIDTELLLDKINNDPDAPSAGDLDHVYITFGVRLWDTSQTGMAYLFNLCENLFPAQGSTKGNYDATPSGDTKPVNNIRITSDNYTYAFQFNYISYEFTSLADIDADSGSAENGYYYSDLSRFSHDTSVETQPTTPTSSFTNNTTVSTDIQLAITDSVSTSDRMRTAALTLKDPYYVSSGKGTYNVGYKASTLTEVANFLSGSGTTNPGTTTTEAANWLQVTTRMAYNNPTPVLQDADGSTSSLEFLTPDLVYENNGSGVLRHVNVASEETTSGQSITYFRAISSGLEAYTMAAPIASLRVVDGATGRFKMVKFNLGAPDDLMAPFVHNFIANLSNKNVTQLFLAGAHASIYIAHYEVIVQRVSKFGGLFAIIAVIIIVVIAWYAAPVLFPSLGWGAGTAGSSGLLSALGLTTVTSASGATLWGATIMKYMVKFAVSQLIKMAVTKIFGDSPVGQFLGSIAGMAAAGGFSVDANYMITVDFSAITDFSIEKFIADWSWTDTFKLTIGLMHVGGTILEYRAKEGYEDLLEEYEEDRKEQDKRLLELNDKEAALRTLEEGLYDRIEDGRRVASLLIDVNVRAVPNPMLAEHVFILNNELHASIFDIDHAHDENRDAKISSIGGYA